MGPLYALEGGCSIYNELSAGPFVYRVADLLSESDRKKIKAVGLSTVNQLFENEPPSAVVLCVDTEPKFFNEPLQKAVKVDWGRYIYNRSVWERKYYYKGPVVYFKR